MYNISLKDSKNENKVSTYPVKKTLQFFLNKIEIFLFTSINLLGDSRVKLMY